MVTSNVLPCEEEWEAKRESVGAVGLRRGAEAKCENRKDVVILHETIGQVSVAWLTMRERGSLAVTRTSAAKDGSGLGWNVTLMTISPARPGEAIMPAQRMDTRRRRMIMRHLQLHAAVDQKTLRHT